MKLFREDPTQNDAVYKFERKTDLHVCSYDLAYGIVPQELVDVYPLSQTENSISPNSATMSHFRRCMVNYLRKFQYSHCVIVGNEAWEEKIAEFLKKTFKGKMKVSFIKTTDLDRKLVQQVLKVIE